MAYTLTLENTNLLQVTFTGEFTEEELKVYMNEVNEKFNATLGIIHTDNGKEFLSIEFQSMLARYNLTHITGRSYKPTTQGLIERAMKTIKSYLARMVQRVEFEPEELQGVVNRIVDNYNNSKHSTIKISPVETAEGNSNKIVHENILNKAKTVHPYYIDIKDWKNINKKTKKDIDGTAWAGLRCFLPICVSRGHIVNRTKMVF